MAKSLAFDLGLLCAIHSGFEETSLGVGSIFKYGKLILHQLHSKTCQQSWSIFFVNARVTFANALTNLHLSLM